MSRPGEDVRDARDAGRADAALDAETAETTETADAENLEAGRVTDAFDGTGGDEAADRHAREIERFSTAERWIHRVTAVLMLTLIATGMVLYLPSLSVRIGHRQAIALIHLYSGWSLPIPMAAGLFSRAYRADARRLNRHTEEDRRWLRVRGWREGSVETFDLKVGKFNAGQKLNAAFMCGAILVMAATGTMMWFPHLVSVSMRTGATFVHDWLALAIGFVVIGHLWFAFNDPGARRGMRRGWVTRTWARRMHPGWVEELDAAEEAGRARQGGESGSVAKRRPGGSAGRG